uniref:CBFD_NFYB_HMF domain-containing protein n=1 Tax=Ganoderma boninense TaxID=34458 RepID=A0A5K1JY85_9APHY|nr:CBFD_NFYB_HMF domain-containing protein [Ganoderma boninense]
MLTLEFLSHAPISISAAGLSYLRHNLRSKQQRFDPARDKKASFCPLVLKKSPETSMDTAMAGSDESSRNFVSIGMFIIDEFSFADEDGKPTGKTMTTQN